MNFAGGKKRGGLSFLETTSSPIRQRRFTDLGVLASSKTALEKLRRVKGKKAEASFLTLLASSEQIHDYVGSLARLPRLLSTVFGPVP